MQAKHYDVGLDVGSTTVKLVVLDEDQIIYDVYRRHLSNIKTTIQKVLEELYEKYGDLSIKLKTTGSGGLSAAKWLNIPFVQEVISSTKAVERRIPQTDVVIELGGEDAKITYFDHAVEQRMNGTCAGGTGAFIDQMASLLQCDAGELNEMAKHHEVIYPIASRCGVFAKTDVQPLLNEGAKKEDIAASVFQAVVNQTISGLACGKPIRGNVAFLGGPLYFLSELRERFIETLGLTEEQIFFPESSQLFVALGAAYDAKEQEVPLSLRAIVQRSKERSEISGKEVHRLPALFQNEVELAEFQRRHKNNKVTKKPIEQYQGNAYLGIDAGSTTSKAALVGEDGEILYTYYSSNNGSPLEQAIKILKDVYQKMPKGLKIANSTVTGYGEALIKAALKIDVGEIETMAHYKGAQYFLPEVDFILDIGGQDMKCIRIKEGMIDDIVLNEACSSGCGSFLETFAKSLDYSVEKFAKEALLAEYPVDLGTRCTVFMNSRVKQAQKEGASVGDISAGLSYSVIKNALYKVIKIKNKDDLGKHIVVQGGTFYSDAVLRTFEKITDRQVVRPNIAGIMGAFGAALIARERHEGKESSSILSKEELRDFDIQTKFKRCGLCGNNCLLTVNSFSDGRSHITGNRCERGARAEGKRVQKKVKLPNLYDYKYRLIGSYQKKNQPDNPKRTIGIPRVLNMYENYPYWHTLFTELGCEVKLSPETDKKIYEKGMETIPSESVCYPAKLVHGHIAALLEEKVDAIFYPSIPYEEKEFEEADNSYSCPIVISYPETIKHNVDDLQTSETEYMHFFITLENRQKAAAILQRELARYGFDPEEVEKAHQKAWDESEKFKKRMQKKGEETLEEIKKKNKKGIVLAGRPYHVDPEINHGLPNVINEMDMAVFTEDSLAHLGNPERPLRVLDQWKYHSRLYAAADFVAGQQNLELVQLTSFGCGIDAVTSDQVQEILKEKGKIYTLIKIDEGNNLGAARIRIRSLKAAMADRSKNQNKPPIEKRTKEVVEFTKTMKKKHTILVPQMSPIHFDFIEDAMSKSGYKVEVLPEVDYRAVDEGLQHVNNDACYPTILVVGQMMEALKSGKYDLDNVSLIMSQTGGPCRASNYMGFIRKALADNGYDKIPVISANLAGLEKHSGFKISLPFINRGIMGMIYGDLFQRVLYRTRPYEMEEGMAEKMYQKWRKIAKENVQNGKLIQFNRNMEKIVRDFGSIPLKKEEKPKVGIVGEILVKYHPTANNQLVQVIESEGGEAVAPDIIDFFLYCAYNNIYKHDALGASEKSMKNSKRFIGLLEWYRRKMKRALDQSERFSSPGTIEKKAQLASRLISVGNQGGEGWFLTGEMMELMEHGVDNIVCVQPFACLPNHVMGKGMIKPIRKQYPRANIVAIDYDPGASEVNQLNRIKLMMSVAKKNLQHQDGTKEKKRSLGRPEERESSKWIAQRRPTV
ncbi:MAG TPA: 2-hydroxyglutaryl-CoA dehydratase [Eubacteriaceae bacterium]|nr:2-hydroxyglutaryl-CoA dehydratase [Eubacteriaceae bacterium]